MTQHSLLLDQTALVWNIRVICQLGRVSNLPTVFTNTLVAVALCNSDASSWQISGLLLAFSLAYIGGMFLNDAFDYQIDKKERPGRPIPSGMVKARDVFWAGFTLLALSVVIITGIARNTQTWLAALISSLLLASFIIFYNCWHKGNPASPLLMGCCRALVYISAGLTLTKAPDTWLFLSALLSFCYVIGLTYTARQETMNSVGNLWPLALLFSPAIVTVLLTGASALTWLLTLISLCWTSRCLYLVIRRRLGDIGSAVIGMIAGISLIDTLFIASGMQAGLLPDTTGYLFIALSMASFCLTLYLQRYFQGT